MSSSIVEWGSVTAFTLGDLFQVFKPPTHKTILSQKVLFIGRFISSF